jgi:hypothetical protein
MAEDDEDGEDTFVPDAEDVDGRKVAILYYRCPECKTRTRFTAQDEREDGILACPGFGCSVTLRLEPRGLGEVQRELDANQRALQGLEDLFPGE